MKVLITGARGFVGKSIVNQLRNEENENVEIFELNSSRQETTAELNESKEKDKNNFAIDITDFKEILKLKKIGAIDAVIHSAGLAHQFDDVKKENFQTVNVKGTENILELSKQLHVKHFILISSVAVYGNKNQKIYQNYRNRRFRKKIAEAADTGKEEKDGKDGKVGKVGKTGITENSECSPEDAYAESKLEGEIVARGICERAGINLTILRLATVIGEEDRGNFLRLIKAIDKRRFFWIGKGVNRKSLIHKEDVARVVVKLLKNKKEGTEIFNVAAEPLRMKQIVAIIGQTLDKNIPGFSVSPQLLRSIFFLNSKIVKNKKIEKRRLTIEKWLAEDVYSAEKIKREYRYKPEIRVEEAIIREVKWYLRKKAEKTRE